MLGLLAMRGFPSSREASGNYLLALSRLLLAVPFLVVEHKLQGTQALVAVACGAEAVVQPRLWERRSH